MEQKLTPKERSRASTAHAPDLDWSQIRETVMLINLAVAQIENTMRDGNDSIDTLTDSFTSMVGHIQIIDTAADEIPDGDAKETIKHNCSRVQEKVHSAIVAFQFYDKLTQRLCHVSNSLAALVELVGDQNMLYSPYNWRGLQEKIKSQYILSEDQKMFDAILQGASVKEALQLFQEHATESQDSVDVELF